MKLYLDLLTDVLNNGVPKSDRTGTGTISVFGRQIRIDISENFPLLTTKKVHFKSIAHELLWFIRGDTNTKYLNDNGVTIWNEWADENGDLGKIYGHQLRRLETCGEGVELVKMRSCKEVEPRRPPAPLNSEHCGDILIGRSFKNKLSQEFYVKRKLRNKIGYPKRYTVQFLDTGGITIAQLSNIRNGEVKDPLHKSVAGKGFLGEGHKILDYEERLYALWRNMIVRCYQQSHPSYNLYGGKGVTVHDEWLCFSDFVKTISKVPFYWEWKTMPGEYELDKDYYGSGCYSKDTCIFLKKSDNVGLATQKGIAFEIDGRLFVSNFELANYLNIHPQRVSDWLLGKKKIKELNNVIVKPSPPGYFYRRKRTIDQIRKVITSIREDPDSRRHIISAWNVGDLEYMNLAPCHILAQFYVDDGKLSCQVYQRSADLFLGVPFNIASYSLLTYMIAQVCELEPYELIYTFGDLHIYSNHKKQVIKQLIRDPNPLPTLMIDKSIKNIDDFRYEHFDLQNYNPHGTLKAKVAV